MSLNHSAVGAQEGRHIPFFVHAAAPQYVVTPSAPWYTSHRAELQERVLEKYHTDHLVAHGRVNILWCRRMFMGVGRSDCC